MELQTPLQDTEICIPAAVYQDTRLSCGARLIYGEVARRCRLAGGPCQITVRAIAERFGISKGSVGTYLRQLQNLGLLDIAPCPNNRRVFSVVPPGGF